MLFVGADLVAHEVGLGLSGERRLNSKQPWSPFASNSVQARADLLLDDVAFTIIARRDDAGPVHDGSHGPSKTRARRGAGHGRVGRGQGRGQQRRYWRRLGRRALGGRGRGVAAAPASRGRETVEGAGDSSIDGVGEASVGGWDGAGDGAATAPAWGSAPARTAAGIDGSGDGAGVGASEGAASARATGSTRAPTSAAPSAAAGRREVGGSEIVGDSGMRARRRPRCRT